MIFLVSNKQFVKNDKKWLKVRDYVIIDGCDNGAIDDDSSKRDIGNGYNNAIVNGAFTPHNRLLSAIEKEKKDQGNPDKPHYTWKTQTMLDDYMNSPEVVAAMLASVKGFTMEISANASGNHDKQRNIFIVIPKKVYKLMADEFLNRFYELMKVEFPFIRSEEELLDNKKLLTKDIKDKRMDELRMRIPKVAKKYHLDEKKN